MHRVFCPSFPPAAPEPLRPHRRTCTHHHHTMVPTSTPSTRVVNQVSIELPIRETMNHIREGATDIATANNRQKTRTHLTSSFPKLLPMMHNNIQVGALFIDEYKRAKAPPRPPQPSCRFCEGSRRENKQARRESLQQRLFPSFI
jgi:hypothetical protein